MCRSISFLFCAIYEGFVRYIAGNQLQNTKSSLKEDVLRFRQRQKIKSEIESLQRKLNQERQPHSKFELHQQIVELQWKLKA